MKTVENSYALASSVRDLNCRGIHLRWSFSLSLFDQRGSSAESGLVDEVAEEALQVQGFGGEGAEGLDGAGVLVPQRVKAGDGLVSIVRTG
jgi:hypothetical protein